MILMMSIIIKMLIPSKGMLEDKLMAALCEFLGFVHVDRERLNNHNDEDNDEDACNDDDYNENVSKMLIMMRLKTHPTLKCVWI